MSKNCSICGKAYKDYGNNAQPINTGRCCDECNVKVVIPERIRQIRQTGSWKDVTIKPKQFPKEVVNENEERNFTVCIEEVLSQKFTVKAKNIKDAMQLAKKKYKACDLIINPNLESMEKIRISIENENGKFEDFEDL